MNKDEEEATRTETKEEDEQRKFVEVHEYLLKGEYPTGSSKSDKLAIRAGQIS